MRQGIGVEGVAYELHPERHAEVIEETSARIRLLDDALAERGVRLVTVIIPYEMQISEEAERIYRDLGIDWEEGFIDLATQRKLEAHLADLEVIDAAAAFLDHEEGKDAARRSNRLGQYFVYDRGGRLDWNHPTREGHRRIAEFLAASGIFAESVASRR